MTADVAQTVEVSLWRGREDGRYETFTVPLRQSLQLLPTTTRAIAAHQGGRDPARRELATPEQ